MDKLKLVEYVADLARIEISEEEKVSLSGQISKIINYIDKLKEVNVEGVEPLRSPHLTDGRLREDEIVYPSWREDILKNAPSQENGYFKIPKVIE